MVLDFLIIQFSSVQLLSHVLLSLTPWTAAHQASLSITSSWSLLKLMSIEQVIPSNHLILCRPLLLLPSIFPSIGVFSSESVLHIRWPKYWSFSFSISPSSEYSGLISFRIDCFDLLAVQGTLKSLLQQLISIYKQLIFTASDSVPGTFSVFTCNVASYNAYNTMRLVQQSPLSCSSAVSVICGQSKSKNIEQKVPDIKNSCVLNCVSFCVAG